MSIGTLFYFSPAMRATSNMDSNATEAHAQRASKQWPEEWLLYESSDIDGYKAVYHGGNRVAVKRGNQWTALVAAGRRWIAAHAAQAVRS